jgi:hypothetical protein
VDASHASEAPVADDDGFLTGPAAPAARPTVPAGKAAPAKGGKSSRRIKVEDIAVPTPPAPDPDADAVDLYALGAVDYVAGVHA